MTMTLREVLRKIGDGELAFLLDLSPTDFAALVLLAGLAVYFTCVIVAILFALLTAGK